MAGNVEEAPILVAQIGPLKGLRWVLSEPLLIGREATCEVVIPDRMVSRFHARIIPTPAGCILEDLKSKNGTHCNGVPVAGKIMLQDGDLIQIALSQELEFLISDATVPLSDFQGQPGTLRLDFRSRSVYVHGHLVDPPLSALQFQVLRVLYERDGQVVDRQQLVSEAWGGDQSSGVSDQALDALLRRLRERIAELDNSHAYIVTVRGHGIRLDNPVLDR
jgi:DNA-binding winged helix-turn-helix (wHTH) protein